MLASLYRAQPVLMFVGAVTGGVVSALLFHFDGYTMSAAVGMGAAVAVLTYAGNLAVRWAAERLTASGAVGSAADNAASLTDDAG